MTNTVSQPAERFVPSGNCAWTPATPPLTRDDFRAAARAAIRVMDLRLQENVRDDIALWAAIENARP